MPTSNWDRLDDLMGVAESMVRLESPEAVCERAVDALAEAFDCDLACIYLLDAIGERFVCWAPFALAPGMSESLPITGESRWPEMMATHRPIVLDFVHPQPADPIPVGTGEYKSAVGVPILAGDVILGTYGLTFKRRHRWTEQDLDCLLRCGRLVGMFIQHARAVGKASDLATLMERKRLCEEIHDNLSQLVGTLNMSTEAALLSSEEGDEDRLRNDLRRIRSTAQEVTRTLREEMLCLRPPTNQTEALIPGIVEGLKRFGTQWGIETDLQVQDGLDPLFVSTQVELQFVRILHESLSNVLRHASASRVSVLLHGDRYLLYMQIHDDGCGFDPDAVPSEHLGLRIMRERAESLGGRLTIESSGDGTTIRVEVPRYSGDWSA